MPGPRLCAGRNARGNRCARTANADSEYCFFHRPLLRAERQQPVPLTHRDQIKPRNHHWGSKPDPELNYYDSLFCRNCGVEPTTGQLRAIAAGFTHSSGKCLTKAPPLDDLENWILWLEDAVDQGDTRDAEGRALIRFLKNIRQDLVIYGEEAVNNA